ncbi:MAG: pyridoxine 5'-phosphate synthase, partial [Planctomycetaceae bacterium]
MSHRSQGWLWRATAARLGKVEREFARGAAAGRESFEQYAAVARHAHSRGLGINAGHDLDLDNLPLFATLPHLAEVSIGHALISRALFHGLHSVVRE